MEVSRSGPGSWEQPEQTCWRIDHPFAPVTCLLSAATDTGLPVTYHTAQRGELTEVWARLSAPSGPVWMATVTWRRVYAEAGVDAASAVRAVASQESLPDRRRDPIAAQLATEVWPSAVAACA